MNNDKKISIVTICFNAAAEIRPTIESVLSQSFSNFEYVIIDGLSSDNTVEIIKSYQDDRIKLISEKDAGIYDAMNKGIRNSTGTWINFMNAGDEFFDKNVLKKIDFDQYQDSGIIYGNHTNHKRELRIPNKPEILRYGKIMGCHQAMFFNRGLLKEDLMYNDELLLNGDTDLITRIYLNGFNIQYVNEKVAVFAGGGASSNFNWKSKLQKYKRILNHFGLPGVYRAIKMRYGMVDTENFAVNKP